MTTPGEYWENVYTTRAEDQVSWFQTSPNVSLRLVKSAAADRSTPIIDVGGGASRLVDNLLEEGYSDITLLDISDIALSRAKTRLGELSQNVTWIVSDITEWTASRHWSIWHDRAVFHFMTDAHAQDAYIRALKQGTSSGSKVIVATFALNGPERCSGLPVQRYSAATLADRLGTDFQLYDEAIESHKTPFGTTQEFIYAAFRRR
jgi:hypothetical protein